MRARFVTDMLTLFGVCLALAVPLDVRADDLTPADLEAVDRALSAPGNGACAEPRDHLRSLRDAYARQEAPVVRSAIAARVPAVLDTLRFCMETAGTSAATLGTIEPARRALAAAQEREECAVPAAGIEQLIAAWDLESSTVVRGAIEARLESLAQTVRFCLETLGPAPTPTTPEPVVRADDAVPSEGAGAPVAEPIEPLPPRALTGGHALGSPFAPAP